MMGWVVAIAYLLGSISGSLCLGRLRGVDIRTLGSGNAGGTNALRTQGWRFALGVALIDIGKSAMAVAIARHWVPGSTEAMYAAVLACMLGHVWPVFHGFRGGKGAAALVGGLILAWPMALLPVLAVWVLVLTIGGYVGLATVLAGFALLPAAFVWRPDHASLAFAAAAALLMLYTHRGNLRRLRAGSEHRFDRARLWRRLAQRLRGA